MIYGVILIPTVLSRLAHFDKCINQVNSISGSDNARAHLKNYVIAIARAMTCGERHEAFAWFPIDLHRG